MRSVRLRDRFKLGLAASLLSVLGILATPARPASGDDAPPRPAQKDSPTRAKPKDATLSLSVEPAEARPGDTVTLKVTAKLNPGWHIYTQAKTQEGDGPRKTVFDLFDPAGLEVAGDWKASRKPESKAEPAFENKVFEYFEDEVTWSIPLKVPAGASPGKKSIRLQASYQICNAQSCSFPGRWTLPEATLTVLPAATGGADAVEARGQEARRLAAGAGDEGQLGPDPPQGRHAYPGGRPARGAARRDRHLQGHGQARARPAHLRFRQAGRESRGPGPDDLRLLRHGRVEDRRRLEARPRAGGPARAGVRQQGHRVLRERGDLEHPAHGPGRRPARQADAPVPGGLPDLQRPLVLPAGPVDAARGHAEHRSRHAGTVAASVPGRSPRPASPRRPSSRPRHRPSSPSSPPRPATLDRRPATGRAPVSEIARRAQEGLIPFLIASALGGLFALVMPCVWPMVPITVNFFVKQGQAARARGRRPAWRSPTAWRSSASSRRSASSSRSSSRRRSSRTWPTTPG